MAAVWTADGNDIVFANNRTGLWRVSATGNQTARQLPLDADGVSGPAISTRGNRLAALRDYIDINVWRIPISGPARTGEPVLTIASTRIDRVLQGSYSPDGRKIAFESNRSGPTAVWVVNADGTNASVLFSAAGTIAGSPTWSPDGRWIAFDSRKDGNPELYVIPSDGGAPRRLTNHVADDVVPYWSHDGKWIYFSSNRSGNFEIYRIPASGGDPVQFTRKGGWGPYESPDGRFLYYTRRLSGGILQSTAARSPLLRIPVDGGEENQLAEQVFDRTWALTAEGIWLLFPGGAQATELRFVDPVSGKISTAAHIGKPARTGLAISPDGGSLLYNQVDHVGTEILLVENFR
jgi:Tol biopolymer transport system component